MQLYLSPAVAIYYFLFNISKNLLFCFNATVIVLNAVLPVLANAVVVNFHIVKDSFPSNFLSKQSNFLD